VGNLAGGKECKREPPAKVDRHLHIPEKHSVPNVSPIPGSVMHFCSGPSVKGDGNLRMMPTAAIVGEGSRRQNSAFPESVRCEEKTTAPAMQYGAPVDTAEGTYLDQNTLSDAVPATSFMKSLNWDCMHGNHCIDYDGTVYSTEGRPPQRVLAGDANCMANAVRETRCIRNMKATINLIKEELSTCAGARGKRHGSRHAYSGEATSHRRASSPVSGGCGVRSNDSIIRGPDEGQCKHQAECTPGKECPSRCSQRPQRLKESCRGEGTQSADTNGTA
jgi:hypothetical protein